MFYFELYELPYTLMSGVYISSRHLLLFPTGFTHVGNLKTAVVRPCVCPCVRACVWSCTSVTTEPIFAIELSYRAELSWAGARLIKFSKFSFLAKLWLKNLNIFYINFCPESDLRNYWSNSRNSGVRSCGINRGRCPYSLIFKIFIFGWIMVEKLKYFFIIFCVRSQYSIITDPIYAILISDCVE